MCTRFCKLKLVGSRINWHSVWLFCKISSKFTSDFDVLQTSENSGSILSLIPWYALHSVKMCTKSSFLCRAPSQHLQWGDPPDLLDFVSWVKKSPANILRCILAFLTSCVVTMLESAGCLFPLRPVRETFNYFKLLLVLALHLRTVSKYAHIFVWIPRYTSICRSCSSRDL